MNPTFMIVALMGALLVLLLVLLTRYVDVGVDGEPAQLRQKLDGETKKMAVLTQANRQLQSNNQRLQQRITHLEGRQAMLNEELEGWQKEQASGDAQRTADRILQEAEGRRDQINAAMRSKLEQVDGRVASAEAEAQSILQAARHQAEEIAGAAYALQARIGELTATEQALKHAVEGYGNVESMPLHGQIDELLQDCDDARAGEALLAAREVSRQIVREGQAVVGLTDRIVDGAAVAMLTEIFNGRVADVLLRVKAEKYPRLAQELRDAWTLVNRLGGRFNNLQISEEYFEARLAELQSMAKVCALRQRAEHDRRWHASVLADENESRKEHKVRFRMADEQTATIRKAMAAVRQMLSKATGARATQLQSKLSELHEKLVLAERVKSQALSMMNRQRAGFVFVVSNVASLGEGVFQIGMTRRVDVEGYIAQLGLNALPFGFDTHLLTFSTDAAALQHALHMRFLAYQINKMDPNRRFYRVPLADIRAVCDELGVVARWEMRSQKLEFEQTQLLETRMGGNPEVARAWRERQLQHAAASAPRKSDEALQTIIPVALTPGVVPG